MGIAKYIQSLLMATANILVIELATKMNIISGICHPSRAPLIGRNLSSGYHRSNAQLLTYKRTICWLAGWVGFSPEIGNLHYFNKPFNGVCFVLCLQISSHLRSVFCCCPLVSYNNYLSTYLTINWIRKATRLRHRVEWRSSRQSPTFSYFMNEFSTDRMNEWMI